MQNYEEIVLFWLQPSHTTEEDLREDIDSLQEIIRDTRIFYDRDQCIETLPSIVDQTIFLVLGPGQSDLIDILSSFTYLEYIYLQESSSHFPYTSQVRGVFPQTKQLLHQLKKDIKTVHNSYTHLGLSKSGELQQPQISTQNLQWRAVEFKWIQLLFEVLLNTARPTENIHKDLLDECRLIYRGNEVQTRLIDEFVAEYEPSKAIWWYTRDTFLYRLLNMALRTENMVIIWKFRYIIQDIYQQLKSMHEKQKNATIGNQQQCRLMVYRGQFISTIELESLKKAEGGLIATTSFFSTTRDSQVAHCFTGAGAKPLNLEPVIFEICLEQSNLEERRPFADISEVSSKNDEDEILLCMATVMRVDSLELGEDMTRIRLTTCPYDNSAWQHFEVDFLPGESFKTNDETFSIFKLGYLLFSMGEYKKAEQFLKMVKASTHSVKNKAFQLFLLLARRMQKILSDPDDQNDILMAVREIQKVYQSLDDCESLPDSLPEINKFYTQNFASFMEVINPKDIHTISSVAYLQKYNEIYENMQKYAPLLTLPSLQLPLIKPVRLFSECTESNDEQMKSEMYDKLRLNMDKTLTENDPSRPGMFLAMAIIAEKEGAYDQAIALVREGLSATCNCSIHVKLYGLLVRVYKKQKNWLAVIESCQSIIDMPQLAPSSSTIVKAHLARAEACAELGDLYEALNSCTKALQLQDQHHTPNHPLTSEIYIKIGDIFQKTEDASAALEYYYKAISYGFPETSSKAYEQIGIMYMCQRNDDVARSNFMKCLDIRQNSIPHQTFSLAWTHILLAQIEHETGNNQQRDFHIQQARTIVILDEDEREFIARQISEILAEAAHVKKNQEKPD